MANEKTFTAPLAILYINGKKVGKIRNVRLTENVSRGDVRGLGTLLSSEKPALAINCSFSASSYVIDLKKLGNIDNPFLPRNASNVEIFTNTVLMQEAGVDIGIYKKGNPTVDSTTKLVTDYDEQKMMYVKNVYLESQSWDITEGQIAGSDLSGTYLEPVYFAQ
jgi:hypothetical protein